MAERKISEKSLENLKRFNQENNAITRESIEISLLQLLEKKDLKKDLDKSGKNAKDILIEGMKELMPVYCVIGKIPAVRNISNKIIVLEKRGRY